VGNKGERDPGDLKASKIGKYTVSLRNGTWTVVDRKGRVYYTNHYGDIAEKWAANNQRAKPL
jgi:hypothetical protein